MKRIILIILIIILGSGCAGFKPERYIGEPVYRYWSGYEKNYNCPTCRTFSLYWVSYISLGYYDVSNYHLYRCLTSHEWLRIVDEDNLVTIKKVEK